MFATTHLINVLSFLQCVCRWHPKGFNPDPPPNVYIHRMSYFAIYLSSQTSKSLNILIIFYIQTNILLSLFIGHFITTCSTVSSWSQWSHFPIWCCFILFKVLLRAVCPKLSLDIMDSSFLFLLVILPLPTFFECYKAIFPFFLPPIASAIYFLQVVWLKTSTQSYCSLLSCLYLIFWFFSLAHSSANSFHLLRVSVQTQLETWLAVPIWSRLM